MVNQLLSLNRTRPNTLLARPESTHRRVDSVTRHQNWSSLQQKYNCNGRFSCLFSDNRREEQARKALEGALGGKKNEFEKWSKEIKRREQAGGGDNAGGGGWFGWGGRFGWFNGDNFWQEAQQTVLAILGVILMYLIIAKGEVLLAVILNPLLYTLRGARSGLTFVTSRILRTISPNGFADYGAPQTKEIPARVSAKEEVLRKWGGD